jgi:hypothetical protein
MAAEGAGAKELGQAEKLIVGGLIVVFLAAIVAMYLLRDDGHWDRLLFLFGALQALCFAGAGALFGTSVQRGNVVQAQQDAAEARATADSAREDAAAKGVEAEAERGKARVEAERGMNLADAVRAAAAAARSGLGQTDRPGARIEDLATGAAPAELAPVLELADRLFPPERR